ncbi:hypothetical protein Taro_019310, partial [Colocasia esculenta]|nr:hypothetical protein [Colocasia esculenta]
FWTPLFTVQRTIILDDHHLDPRGAHLVTNLNHGEALSNSHPDPRTSTLQFFKVGPCRTGSSCSEVEVEHARRPCIIFLAWWSFQALEHSGRSTIGPCGGHDEQLYGVSDRVYFPYRASCSFASALPLVAAGRAPDGDGAVVGVPVASSGSPFSVYVTLGVELEVEQPERQQRSGTGSTRAGRRRTAVTEDKTALLERFLHLRPPMFHVYQLKGAAHEWWRVQRQTHFQGQRLDHITWQQFSEVFHGEYFPDYARRERRDQFHALVQDDLTVSQYYQRFVQLLRYVPHVAGSDQACAERFIAGLRPDLRWGVTAHMCTTLGEAVAKATALDREIWQPQQQQQQQSTSPGLQSNQLSKELSRAVRRQFATPVAYRATSEGIAPWGKPRSSSSQCSTLSSRLSTSTLLSSRHRVSSSGGSTSNRLSSFHSRSSTSHTSSSSSTLSSRRSSSSPSRAACVLVDPGASLCFASEEFSESLACHAPERQCDVMVDLPSGDYMRSFGYLEGVAVEVEGHQLPARLYALQICNFDVILGMDLLEAHSIVVDFQRKTVRFRIPGEPVLCFRGETSQQRQGARRAEETGR